MPSLASPARYAATVGLETADIAPVRESVDLLRHSGIDYEFRTTVVDELHDEKDFAEIGAWISGAKRYYLQPFTARDTVPFAGFHAPDGETLNRWLEIVRPWVPSAAIRGEN